jgi:hypothetical protein
LNCMFNGFFVWYSVVIEMLDKTVIFHSEFLLWDLHALSIFGAALRSII